MNNNKLIISVAPHIVTPRNTASIMKDVTMALMPALLWAIYIFGLRALLVTATCVIGCVFFEWASRKIMKRPQSIKDFSAVVTGIILAFSLPVEIPLWIALLGSFLAIVIVKQCFGGLGSNFANPAVVARIVLLLSYPAYMTKWTATDKMCNAIIASSFYSTGASTPLELYTNAQDLPTNLQMFLGLVSGSIGEISVLALAIGASYLFARKVIEPAAPLAYIVTVGLTAAIAGLDPVFHVFCGGVFFAAIFMCTDPVTTPSTSFGRAIFGIGAGVLTMFMRMYATYPDSMPFAILLMNILTPYIDNFTLNRARKGGKY